MCRNLVESKILEAIPLADKGSDDTRIGDCMLQLDPRNIVHMHSCIHWHIPTTAMIINLSTQIPCEKCPTNSELDLFFEQAVSEQKGTKYLKQLYVTYIFACITLVRRGSFTVFAGYDGGASIRRTARMPTCAEFHLHSYWCHALSPGQICRPPSRYTLQGVC